MRRFSYRVASVVVSAAALGVVGMAGPAGASAHGPNGSKSAFFTNGAGTGSWVAGSDALVASDTDNKVVQLSSPDGSSYAGFQGHAIDGLSINDISALSYDYRVTTPNWTVGGSGSPRLVVVLSDGGNAALNPVDTLSSDWAHMDAISGAVDGSGGTTCGSQYQASWSAFVACHPGTTITAAYVVNDSGGVAPLTIQIDNLTLNSTVYSAPTTSKH